MGEKKKQIPIWFDMKQPFFYGDGGGGGGGGGPQNGRGADGEVLSLQIKGVGKCFSHAEVGGGAQ